MTPSLARMILSLGDRFLKPVKWFSIPQCWRFESTQRGRKREHLQWNMDIVGIDEVEAEVPVDCSTFDRVLLYLEAAARGQHRWRVCVSSWSVAEVPWGGCFQVREVKRRNFIMDGIVHKFDASQNGLIVGTTYFDQVGPTAQYDAM